MLSQLRRPLSLSQYLYIFSIVVLVSSYSPVAMAWGKRGHSIVCQTAAYLNATNAQTDFLKSSSFDLGYYCNVPDLVWKRPATYKLEWFNHFMDMERFDRGFRSSNVKNPFEADRATFDRTFPQIKETDGRAFWRIREFDGLIDDATKTLRKSDLSEAERQETQLNWISISGFMGHYVGDLSQPLHVTENYDGGMTNQKGIHHFYEEVLVDELYSNSRGNLEADVEKGARKQWAAFHKSNKNKSTLELLILLSEESNKFIPQVLKTDMKIGRKNIVKAAQAHRATLLTSLIRGSLTQAEILSRHLGWDFSNSSHGDAFTPEPEYIRAPDAKSASPNSGSSSSRITGPGDDIGTAPPALTTVSRPTPAATALPVPAPAVSPTSQK